MFSIDVPRARRPMYLLIVGSHYCVMRFAYALHMRQHNFVPFPCLYIELFELVIEVIFHSVTAPRLPATKLICSNVHSGVAALSAPMMLLCCSLASSSFTLRKSLFLSDDRLNSRMYSRSFKHFPKNALLSTCHMQGD